MEDLSEPNEDTASETERDIVEGEIVFDNETEDEDASVLIVLSPATSAVVVPYMCDECGEEFAMSRQPAWCPICGIEYTGIDKSAVHN